MVTLREFIKIAPDLIEPWCCRVVLEYEDEFWGRDQKVLLHEFNNYGELDQQFVLLREVKEEKEKCQ